MKKTLLKLSILSFSAILFLIGLVMFLFVKDASPTGLGCIAISTLIFLSFGIAGMIKAHKHFGLRFGTLLKIGISIIAFVLFTIGLGLFLVGGMVVLGIILAAIGLLTIIFLLPMFIAFVRVNPFEHIIISPDYDDMDTEFFSKRHKRMKENEDD